MDQAKLQETIFALSSAPGKAGVSIIRVSGPKAWEGLQNLIGEQKSPTPRYAAQRYLYNSVPRETGSIIDHAMVIGFVAPQSFTGEDVIEYHCHGSPAVIEEMLSVLSKMEGHRLAEHGEFTRRAFENGKMDLTAAEAIADLIDAETLAQKEQALTQMGGALADLYHGWADELTKALAYIEAIIDFPDEEVPDEETAKARPAVETLHSQISDYLNDNRRGERLRDGVKVAVIGAPNAGKSSLVNALARREVAIVSDMAGTTRDVIEVPLNLGGYPVLLSDTAGLRPDQIGNSDHDRIESEGMRRALQRAEEADITILLFDGTADAPDPHTLNLLDERALCVVNKSDVSRETISLFGDTIVISTKTEDGFDQLLDILTDKIKTQIMHSANNMPSLTRSRHRHHLEDTVEFLGQALEQSAPELMAQELRFAVNALGRITGRVDVEDLLDVIFKDFCIGK